MGADTSRRYFTYALTAGLAVYLVQFLVAWFSVTPPNAANSSLFFPDLRDSFMDFFNVNAFVVGQHPYRDAGSSYPPLVLLLARLTSLFSRRMYSVEGAFAVRDSVGGMVVYLIFAGACLGGAGFLMFRRMSRAGMPLHEKILLLIVFLCSSPVLFLFQRGNFLLLTLTAVCLFLYFCDSDRRLLRHLAYACLGVAVGMKLYPAALALLLLREKRYRDVLWCALYSIGFLLVPFLAFEGGFSNIPLFLENLFSFTGKYYNEFFSEGYVWSTQFITDVSLRAVVLVTARLVTGINLFAVPAAWETVTAVLGYLLFPIAVASALLTRRYWQALTAVALLMILFPVPSVSYTVVFLLPAAVAFLLRHDRRKPDGLYYVLFFLIICPVQSGHVISPRTEGLFYGVTTHQYIQGLAMVVMFVAVFVDTLYVRIRSAVQARKQAE